jgi:beta-glucosidase/6-phospho-beta-glucosidase/beta-galactosidase
MWKSKYHRSIGRRSPHSHPFLFATGIENSYPLVPRPDGRSERVDEMDLCEHYARWREDLALVKDLRLDFLRYGPPYYRVHIAPGRYDWSFTDEVFAEMRRMNIEPIVDLCHFGVPDWVGGFQNPDWPELFADYARAFSMRFPWCRFFTPVNEIYVCAKFSAYYGWWNEQLKSDRYFITAVKNLARATLLAEKAILEVRPDALFIQSESSERYHAAEPAAASRATFLNQLRFLPFDLSYGVDVNALMYEYLLDNGMTIDEYQWFLENGAQMKPYCIMGNDYYATNEHWVKPEGPVQDANDIFGYYIITHEYYDRYHMPVMHTETNQRGTIGGDPVHWLRKQWANMIHLKEQGVPIIGFTWYSLIHQVDWNSNLREDNHHIDELGLCDINRTITPVGNEYRELVQKWRDILPMESHAVDLPG